MTSFETSSMRTQANLSAPIVGYRIVNLSVRSRSRLYLSFGADDSPKAIYSSFYLLDMRWVPDPHQELAIVTPTSEDKRAYTLLRTRIIGSISRGARGCISKYSICPWREVFTSECQTYTNQLSILRLATDLRRYEFAGLRFGVCSLSKLIYRYFTNQSMLQRLLRDS